MSKGPDFSKDAIETLAKRAGQKCSKPDCQEVTSGPHTDPAKAINVGEAAHIKGARDQPNNRYDPNMTDEERRDISNGIWLCRLHAREIDTDAVKYPVELLLKWKADHEQGVREGRRGTQAAREILVKEGGVGGTIENSGDGVGLEILHSGKNPAERITVEGKGTGEVISNTGSGTGKRIISTGGGMGSQVIVRVNQPVAKAIGMKSKIVLAACSNCGEQLSLSKVIQGFAGDVEPQVEAKCPRCNTSIWI